MFTILNPAGLQMELSPATVLSVERENPLFNDADKFFQDTVYNAKAPLSPGNKAFFGYGHRVEAQKGVYAFDVQVFVVGHHFFTGKCVYKTSADAYDFYLKINFGALADKAKKVYLSQIRTDDRYTTSNKTDGDMEAFMMDTAQNPHKYPFCFFPVENSKMFDAPQGAEGNYAESGWMNQFSIDYQSFAVRTSPWAPSGKYFINPEVPFFKLTYILQQLIRYLGFVPSGGFFQDPEVAKLYVYTRKAIAGGPIPNAAARGDIMPSMSYMPYMTIADFLKQVRERIHIAIHFDVVSGTCTVESFNSINSSPITDITNYVERIEENGPQEQKGYAVILKKDDQDEAYNNPYRLVIGNNSGEPSELDCTTLNSASVSPWNNQFATTAQFILNDSWYQKPNINTEEPYYPNPFSWNMADGMDSRNNWTLRLLKYNGMKDVGGGLHWPEAVPFSLESRDAAWYQFLNDSKSIKVSASFPPAVLNTIKLTNRLGFESNEGVWTECIIKKMDYSLGDTRELVRVKLELMSLSYDLTTTYHFDRSQDASEITAANFMSFKAYWDPQKTGFTELQMEMTSTTPDHTLTVPKIVNPSDSWGVGGDTVWAVKSAPDMNVTTQNATLIIRQGRPKYIDRYGLRYYFSFNGEYSYYNFGAIFWNRQDQSTWWIVF